jgi:predicted nucleic acid-binding protein
MADCRVVNASPLITLAKVGLLDLLEEAECVLVIPAPVAQEVLRWPAEDPARKARATALLSIRSGKRVLAVAIADPPLEPGCNPGPVGAALS